MTLRGNGRIGRKCALAALGVGLLVLVLANVHLAYVALVSEPGCVPHSRSKQSPPGEYRAARSSC